MKTRAKKGFTLIELLVVIAIIAVLATVSVVGYTRFVGKANLSKAQTELAQVRAYIHAAEMGNEEISLTDAELSAYLTEMGFSEEKIAMFRMSDTDVIVYQYDDSHTISVGITDSEFVTGTVETTTATGQS
jgi:prepilin-type N-terminal cleavage/methylation domain-containing protein